VACDAGRKLVSQPDTITAIGQRNWTQVGQR